MSTKAQRDAVADVLTNASGYTTRDDLVTALIDAAATSTSRWVFVMHQPGIGVTVHGPYGSPDTARKAVSSGAITAATDAATGGVYALTPGPRPKTTRAT